MKTAQLEEVKRDSTRLDDLVSSDDSTHLVRDGKIVAVITPIPPQPSTGPMHWPNFAHQREAIFGKAVLPPDTVRSLLEEEREERT
jgi:hypothetical protein